ncbi:MAG: hypothetical protein OES57_00090 [Acidimicrobiia bacterium]|nr:hypothetical protein [Acidimicrobiia bacterium]
MPAVTNAVTWVPTQGKVAEFLGAVATAKKIHERLGAQVTVARCVTGGTPMSVVYMTTHESGSAYGAFMDALGDDEEWNQFWASQGAGEPVGRMEGSALYAEVEL